MKGSHPKMPFGLCGHPLRTHLIPLAFLVGYALLGHAYASAWPPKSVALYWAKWADVNLLESPGRLIERDLHYMEPELVAVSVAYLLTDDPELLRYLNVKQVDSEFTLVKHITGQTHWEGNWALGLRTGPLMPSDYGLLTFQLGNGISYALEKPTFEKGADDVRGEGTHQFQYHMTLELAYSLPTTPQWEVATRLHHRSGVYGLLSPRKTGSNYIGVLVRYRL